MYDACPVKADRQLKLLFFISSLRGGGAERVTSSLANYWSANGWEITVVTLSSQADDLYQLNPDIKRLSLSSEGDSKNLLFGIIQNFRRILALRRMLLQVKPDVALAMMEKANVLLAVASWRLNSIRCIGSERIYPPYHPIGAMWEQLRKYSYKGLYAVIAQTSKGAEWVRCNTHARRAFKIPNPVIWPLPTLRPRVEVDSVCAEGRKIILAVGRLTDQKQFDLLIDCFSSISGYFDDWDLVILGEGPSRNDLENIIANSGLKNRVFLPGMAGNVADWYKRADLYILSSRFEGFPNALIEAMAYGLAVISFDCETGPGDIIQHGVNGLLVPAGDIAALNKALRRLMSSDALRGELAARAVDVRQMFSVDRIAEQWVSLFEENCA